MKNLLKRLEQLYALINMASRYWALILPIGGGSLAAWAAHAANLFTEYAPFSWVASGLVGFALICVALKWLASARIGNYSLQLQKRISDVDYVNPLDSTFESRRISVTQIQSPVGNRIENRTFVDCDIVGPANILVLDCTIRAAGGSSVDAVHWTTDPYPHNCTTFVNCTFTNCRFFMVTFLVPITRLLDFAVHNFQGLNWLTTLPPPPPNADPEP